MQNTKFIVETVCFLFVYRDLKDFPTLQFGPNNNKYRVEIVEVTEVPDDTRPDRYYLPVMPSNNLYRTKYWTRGRSQITEVKKEGHALRCRFQ